MKLNENDKKDFKIIGLFLLTILAGSLTPLIGIVLFGEIFGIAHFFIYFVIMVVAWKLVTKALMEIL